MRKFLGLNRLRMVLVLLSMLFVAACGGGGGDTDDIKENSAPIANAGPDQNVSSGSTVTLSGGGSDADGDLLAYSWAFTSKPSGSTATLSDSTVPNPTFIAEVDGAYVLTLTVNDGNEISFVDSVTVTAASLNSAPTANAGPDQNVATGSLVTLSGIGSDADSDLLSLSWAFTSRPSGSTATLSNMTVANPTFTADMDGTYILTLTVHDGTVNSQADSVTVTAATLNSAPTANAGPNQNVATGSLVTLSGTGSDADSDLLSFSWAFTSRPSSSTTVLSSTTAADPTFTADRDGTYTLSLTVNDGKVSSQPHSVTITAQTPALKIGSPYLAADGLTVTMNKIEITEKVGSYTYTINYTLQNLTTDKKIDEATFKLYFTDGTGLPQYGFFGSLFPGDSLTRGYVFEEIKSKVPSVIGYHHDQFFSNTPPVGTLKWEVVLP